MTMALDDDDDKGGGGGAQEGNWPFLAGECAKCFLR